MVVIGATNSNFLHDSLRGGIICLRKGGENMLIVQKYGGTSLVDGQRVQAAARRVAELHRQGNRMVVVVSAQGEMTDLLIEKATEVNPRGSSREMDAYLAAG